MLFHDLGDFLLFVCLLFALSFRVFKVLNWGNFIHCILNFNGVSLDVFLNKFTAVLCAVFSYVQLFVTAPPTPPQTVALQAPLSMAFSKQEYWDG